MELLDKYDDLRNKVFDYFGYKEDWRVFPIDDARKYFWRLDGEGRGDSVHFADTEEELNNEEGNYYVNEIYTYTHPDRWVYRGEEYTMILVDTNADGNIFLQIFKNANERD